MTTAVWSSSLSSYDCAGGKVAWTTTTTVTLDPYQLACTRRHDSGTVLDVLHDGCTIDNIKIEFTAGKSGFGSNLYAYAEFAGVILSVPSVAASSTLYSTNGGAGTLPSVVREALMSSGCRNDDTTYSASVNMSLPLVTVTYTDNGMPYMLQFAL